MKDFERWDYGRGEWVRYDEAVERLKRAEQALQRYRDAIKELEEELAETKRQLLVESCKSYRAMDSGRTK